jgi:hypothetical protein
VPDSRAADLSSCVDDFNRAPPDHARGRATAFQSSLAMVVGIDRADGVAACSAPSSAGADRGRRHADVHDGRARSVDRRLHEGRGSAHARLPGLSAADGRELRRRRVRAGTRGRGQRAAAVRDRVSAAAECTGCVRLCTRVRPQHPAGAARGNGRDRGADDVHPRGVPADAARRDPARGPTSQPDAMVGRHRDPRGRDDHGTRAVPVPAAVAAAGRAGCPVAQPARLGPALAAGRGGRFAGSAGGPRLVCGRAGQDRPLHAVHTVRLQRHQPQHRVHRAGAGALRRRAGHPAPVPGADGRGQGSCRQHRLVGLARDPACHGLDAAGGVARVQDDVLGDVPRAPAAVRAERVLRLAAVLDRADSLAA